MALVELSIVEQRYRAVLEAAAGPPPTRSAGSRPSGPASPARLPMFPRASVKHVLGQIRQASGGTRQDRGAVSGRGS